jgi:hypothetical protein
MFLASTAGGRGAIKPSISPSAKSSEMVLPSGALSRRTPLGNLMVIFSGRPACSMPPLIQCMSLGFTPKSSSRMARAQTLAVSWYSGTPTFLPFRSCGFLMRSVRHQIEVWRNIRETNAGTPT